jgi:ECF sigma factor
MSDVTRILSQIEQGDPQTAEKLLPLVYGELRKPIAAKTQRIACNIRDRWRPHKQLSPQRPNSFAMI